MSQTASGALLNLSLFLSSLAWHRVRFRTRPLGDPQSSLPTNSCVSISFIASVPQEDICTTSHPRWRTSQR